MAKPIEETRPITGEAAIAFLVRAEAVEKGELRASEEEKERMKAAYEKLKKIATFKVD